MTSERLARVRPSRDSRLGRTGVSPRRSWALFGYGFRPFFLGGHRHAPAAIPKTAHADSCPALRSGVWPPEATSRQKLMNARTFAARCSREG
jgi:hypothetical protein